MAFRFKPAALLLALLAGTAPLLAQERAWPAKPVGIETTHVARVETAGIPSE